MASPENWERSRLVPGKLGVKRRFSKARNLTCDEAMTVMPFGNGSFIPHRTRASQFSFLNFFSGVGIIENNADMLPRQARSRSPPERCVAVVSPARHDG